eukprot:c24316_g1_i2 orf=189-2066(+)
MGDVSYSASDLQSIQDTQKPETMALNHVGQNLAHIDEHRASSIEKENLLGLPSSEAEGFPSSKLRSEIPPQQNGDHAGMEESETHSEIFKPERESEAAQTDVSSLDGDGTISLNPRELDSNGAESRDCSPLPKSPQEGMQESDGANAVMVGDTMEDGDGRVRKPPAPDRTDNIIREDEYGLCREALSDSEKKEEIYLEERDGVGDELLTGTIPCISSDISTESSSMNNVQPPLIPTATESGKHTDEVTDELGGDFQALPSLTSTGESEVPFFQKEVDQSLDTRKQEWLDQSPVATSLISTDLEGWHRFDAEEVITNTDHSHGTDQRLELWEKLLDDGLDGIDRHAQNSPLQLAPAPQLALRPFSHEDDQYELASLGNPFIEGLGRVSSFSEADGFVRNGDLPSSARLSQSLEVPSLFGWKEAPFHAVGGSDDSSAGMATVEGKNGGVQLESVNEHGHKSLMKPKPLASFDSMEPFEAPSFMSLVDPKSQALFAASMPMYQVGSGFGQENGGVTWVANFDLMAPSTQEISRSVSLPRSGTEASEQRPGQSFSFASGRGEEPSKKEKSKSGLLSPKLSPLMQKVVSKVRTTPAAANGVLNTVRQAVSPKDFDKTSSSKSILACCVCW